MYLKTALEIIVAFFCVLGLYAFVRIMFQQHWCCKNIVIAVEILSLRDVSEFDKIVKEALGTCDFLKSRRTVVITTIELSGNKSLRAAVKKYGLKLCVYDN